MAPGVGDRHIKLMYGRLAYINLLLKAIQTTSDQRVRDAKVSATRSDNIKPIQLQ